MSETDTAWRKQIDDDVKNLIGTVAGLESGMKSMVNRFDVVIEDFKVHGAQLRSIQQPKWGIVIAGFTLTFVVMSSIFSAVFIGYIRDVNRIDSDLRAVSSKRISEQDPVQTQAIIATDLGLRSVQEIVRKFQLEQTNKHSTTAADLKALGRHVYGGYSNRSEADK